MSENVAPNNPRRRRKVVDSCTTFHNVHTKYWTAEEAKHLKETRFFPNRMQQSIMKYEAKVERKGDAIVKEVKDLFFNGMGIQWGPNQVRVFDAFLASCLPFIYGDTWPTEKARVLHEWGLKEECKYTLVNMARRNGKTFVTSGTAAALLLKVPGIRIIIFSTCRRTSQLLLQEVDGMIQKAFAKGTHVKKEDYLVVSQNMEGIVFECKGTKRAVASLPGIAPRSGAP